MNKNYNFFFPNSCIGCIIFLTIPFRVSYKKKVFFKKKKIIKSNLKSTISQNIKRLSQLKMRYCQNLNIENIINNFIYKEVKKKKL